MIYLALTIGIVFLGYVWYIYRKFGVLTSVSASTYHLEGNARYFFMGTLWTVAFLNLFMGLGVWGFLASGGLLFAGITVQHSEPPGSLPHAVGSVLAIVATFVGLTVVYDQPLPGLIFLILTVFSAVLDVDNFIWWVEVYAIILTVIGYLFI